MRVLTAQVYNPKNEAFATIGLPASYEELQDTLQLVNGNNENCAANIQEFFGKINPLEGKAVQTTSLYELNYFATIYHNLQEYEQIQFAGLVESNADEFPEMKTILNLALNTPKFDCYFTPCTTDKDLGEFYVENELIPELEGLENITDEQYRWVCLHLDFEKIGKEMREQEKGVFTSAGYLLKNEEVEQLYEGTPILPNPCDYIFRLELALIPEGDELNDQNTLSLKLPASAIDVQRALEEIGAESMDDCCFYGYESLVVPQLSDCYGDNDDFAVFNQLAEKINWLDNEDLVKYKAMLESVQNKDIETAVSVYEKMEAFSLDGNCTTATDYANKVLETLELPLMEELHFYLSKDGYGRSLMQHNGVDQTPYGMLIPSNGIKLSKQLQNQIEGMELNMSM